MRRGKLLAGLTAVVASTVVAGGVVAATQSSDEAALAPNRGGPSQNVERRVERLLRRMTIDEKLNQIQLLSDGQVQLPNGEINPTEAKNGVGSVFSLVDPQKINALQKVAVEESRLGIPILFAYDTIHGFRTIFPIPLGAASSFDPGVAADDHRIGARESAAVGLKQIYSPMVDVSHEPRWGRISEAGGEDPYLNSVFAAARVKAAQGRNYADPDKVVTSVKHYAAYGQPEGGRDYNTTDMSVSRLHNLYLPPFKAAIDAGSDTVMCSFNAINGLPGCAHKELETGLLKRKWGFDGFIESDYTAVAELRTCPPVEPAATIQPECGHGIAEDGPGAAAAALNAGTDSEMVSKFIRTYGKRLLAQGRISQRRVDDAVRRILRVKFRAGLFENPYVNPDEAEAAQLLPDALKDARRGAGRSMVLLKNEGANGPTLPLSKDKKTAVIGPLAKNGHDMLGPWWGRGRDEDAVTVLAGIEAQSSQPTTYAEGCSIADKEPPNNTPAEECGSDAGFDAAVAAANAADQVVLALGESRGQSGEAASRSEIDLPGRQEELIRRIKATGKPFVVVLFNGRPLTLEGVVDDAPAILEAWFPGVQAGHAVADVVFGKVNPGGKLPVTFPRRVGQVPIYYNHEPTGRPCNEKSKYNSRYRDIPTCEPQYPFGFGLSYSRFETSNLRLSASQVSRRGRLTASVDVKNVSGPEGDEVVQLYLRDPVASLSQPVRRLRGFERVTLAPNEKRTVTFTLDRSDFGFYDNRGRLVVEPGRIEVYAGNSSKAELTQSFMVTG